MTGLLQCLKCSKQFDKTTAEVQIALPTKKNMRSFADMGKDYHCSLTYSCLDFQATLQHKMLNCVDEMSLIARSIGER